MPATASHGARDVRRGGVVQCIAGVESQFETNGLKGMYFPAVETRALSTRGVNNLDGAAAAPERW